MSFVTEQLRHPDRMFLRLGVFRAAAAAVAADSHGLFMQKNRATRG